MKKILVALTMLLIAPIKASIVRADINSNFINIIAEAHDLKVEGNQLIISLKDKDKKEIVPLWYVFLENEYGSKEEKDFFQYASLCDSQLPEHQQLKNQFLLRKKGFEKPVIGFLEIHGIKKWYVMKG